jgi:hypothetical protein
MMVLVKIEVSLEWLVFPFIWLIFMQAIQFEFSRVGARRDRLIIFNGPIIRVMGLGHEDVF